MTEETWKRDNSEAGEFFLKDYKTEKEIADQEARVTTALNVKIQKIEVEETLVIAQEIVGLNDGGY